MIPKPPIEIDFFTFVYKRQLIWYKRFILKEDFPWTIDPVLQKYKIINMYRELDKCTIYLTHLLQDVVDRKKILLTVMFFRFFNLCNIYEDLQIKPFSKITPEIKSELMNRLSNLKKRKPIFNDAYLISSGGKGVKHEHIISILTGIDFDVLIQKIDASKTAEESFQYLVQIPMVGPFIACEFWTDLCYFRWFKQNWTDNDFVNIGPGSKWGLEILYGKLSKRELKEKLSHLHKMQEKILPTIHEQEKSLFAWKEIAYKNACSHYPFLSITNIEGSLCEFRKYYRLSQGLGKKRYFRRTLMG